jgi:arsenate reductase (glutaredoxin)
MIIYIYPKCSTCKKALAYLKEKKITCEVREIHVTPPSLEELKHMLKLLNGKIKKLFNTSGLRYRELNLSQKLDTLTSDEALSLLEGDGMLVKRPFLIDGSIGLTGFKEAEWAKIST